MDKSQKVIEEYLAKANDKTEPATTAPEKTAEDQVEDKAREKSGPTATSVLQKRNQLSEMKLEQRIDQISAKHAGRIDESVLRGHVSHHLQQNNGQISEADLIQIQDNLLTEPDQTQPDAPLVGPPPFLSGSLDAVGNKSRAAADWMAGLKTPGGVGFLVFVLVFFVWAIVPVNDTGQTRLQLLWGILTGQVGFSQAVHDQEVSAAQNAVAQSGIPSIIPPLGGGNVGTPIPVIVPFIPSFEEF